MSGYAILYCNCLRCGRMFGCNPNLVPAIRIEGVKQPLCESCHEILNRQRIEMGLEPWPQPLPGAYDACPEEEL